MAGARTEGGGRGAEGAGASKSRGRAKRGSGRTRLLKTGELAQRSGLSRQVIHSYTTMGLLRPASVNRAGHKLFDPTAVVRLRLIQNLVARGYTLRDIRQIFFRDR